uniref:Uncharacterized protein LOC111105581 n=1 Tax=Crassostrea virginica TaxID=6565 RepID=A0A8B8AWU9_CRAVI|nr:uncharacterized protein LOC111105581 [Crassostrea virginica]
MQIRKTRLMIISCLVFFGSSLLIYNFELPLSVLYKLSDKAAMPPCTNEFIFDVDIKRNENAKVLEECKDDQQKLSSSITENMKYVSKYVFTAPYILIKQFKLDRNGILYLSTQAKDNAKFPTFVTALSDNHYEESIGFFRMMNTMKRNKYSDLKLIVYNLGLSKNNTIAVEKMCNCSIRNFPFEIFPKHVQHLRGFAWKPLIIQTVLLESDFVLWMDTSIRLNNTDPYFQKAKRYGIQVLTGYGLISVRTHRHLFEALRENPCLFNYPELQAGLVLITRSCLTLTYIMRPWVSCALQYGCMDIPNAENFYDCSNERNISSCHRSDQSVLGIILTRLFNSRRHQFVLGNDFAEVCRGCLMR